MNVAWCTQIIIPLPCTSVFLDYTALQKKFKYTIDECDHFYVLLVTESESDISFAPSRLDFAAWEVTIFGKQ